MSSILLRGTVRCCRNRLLPSRAALSSRFNSSAVEASSAVPGLDVPLEGLPRLKPAKDLPAPHVETTTLANGVRVTSIDNYGQGACLSAFIDTGAKYETVRGVCSHIEKLAFASTETRSQSKLTQELEELGASCFAQINREQSVYGIELLRDRVPEAVDILADIVQRPLFKEDEFFDAQAIMELEREEMAYEAQQLTMEYLHAAAFGADSALGHPVLCPSANFDLVTPAHLKEFMQQEYRPENVVIAAAGVEHDLLVKEVEAKFNSLPGAAGTPSNRELNAARGADSVARDLYVGGGVCVAVEPLVRSVSTAHVQQKPPLTHVALGFHVGGWHDPDLVPLSVLFTLLGGGHSFSAGGPGKGLYSRLYREVLIGYQFVESTLSSAAIYDHTGVFSIYGSCAPSYTSQLIEIICNQFFMLAAKKADDVDVARARNQLKSQVLMNLESRTLLCDDLGRQTLSYGKRQDPMAICDEIDAVTADDLYRVSRKMLRETPSFVAYGDQQTVMPFEAIEQAFQTVNAQIGNTGD
eukprot:INCI11158.1.p1 GENE.INCI11158.1~~INCI11158.1.p1  ORF type:complete len:526 (-),score=103.25 INCI11158.1:648-2225(-)